MTLYKGYSMFTTNKANILFTYNEKKYIKHEIETYKIEVLFKNLNIRLINISLLLLVTACVTIFHLYYIHMDHIVADLIILSLIGINYILILICGILKYKSKKTLLSAYVIILTSWLPAITLSIQFYYVYLPYLNIIL